MHPGHGTIKQGSPPTLALLAHNTSSNDNLVGCYDASEKANEVNRRRARREIEAYEGAAAKDDRETSRQQQQEYPCANNCGSITWGFGFNACAKSRRAMQRSTS